MPDVSSSTRLECRNVFGDDGLVRRGNVYGRVSPINGETLMSIRTFSIKTLGAAAVMSAILAGPVFAQDTYVRGPAYHHPAYALRHYRGTYNQAAPLYGAPATVDGFSVQSLPRDPSWVGGTDPSFRPSGS